MRRSLGVAGGLVLGVVLSQFPEYAQQYTQRLGGAVDELRTIVTDFDTAASQAGLSREQALERYAHSPDTFLAGRGVSMSGIFARYTELEANLEELKSAGPLQRLRLLPAYFDSDVGARTLDDFRPAVPVTTEGFAYAAAGFGLGYVIISILYALALLPFRWQRRRRWRITEPR